MTTNRKQTYIFFWPYGPIYQEYMKLTQILCDDINIIYQ